MLLSDLVDLIKKGNSNFISSNIVEDLNIKISKTLIMNGEQEEYLQN